MGRTRAVVAVGVMWLCAGQAGCLSAEAELTWGTTSAELRTGRYRIRAVHSKKCVDVAGGGPSNGVVATQRPCASGDAQRWQLGALGGDAYELTLPSSGRCLARPRSPGHGPR